MIYSVLAWRDLLNVINTMPGIAGIIALNIKIMSADATAISAGIFIKGSSSIDAVSLNPKPLNVIGTISAEIIIERTIATK